MDALDRVDITEAARAMVRKLVAEHGPVMFHQSGGCCDGSAPMCYPEGEFLISPRDVLLGEVEGCKVWIDKTQWATWSHTRLTIDLVEGRGAGFSLEAPHGVRFLTGHLQNNESLDIDWRKVADPDCTLVIYMGLANLRGICDELIRAGLPATTPAAAVHGGTTARQRKVISYLADNCRDRGFQARVVDRGGQPGQVGQDFLLLRGGTTVHGRRRRRGRQAGADQFVANGLQVGQAHVNDQGTVGIGDFVPVDIQRLVVLQVPGEKTHAVVEAAVGKRNAAIAAAAGRRGNARYDFERNAVLAQNQRFLAAATEDVRVAALEAHQASTGQCEVHDDVVDLILRYAVFARRFTDRYLADPVRNKRENFGADQAIENDDVGLLDQT